MTEALQERAIEETLKQVHSAVNLIFTKCNNRFAPMRSGLAGRLDQDPFWRNVRAHRGRIILSKRWP